MNSKKLIIFSVMACALTFVSAQIQYTNKKGGNYHPYADNKWPAGNAVKHGNDSGQNAVTSFYVDRRAKKWSLGVGAGPTFFFGDADKIQPSWHARLFGKYSVSQTFGLKAEYNIGQVRGARDFQFPTLYKDKFKFKSRINDFNVQMVFTLGNISFLRPLRKTQMNLFIGGGWVSYRSVARFNDQRLYLGDYYLSHYLGRGIPNPNLGKDVTETAENRRWIVPFGFGVKHNLGRNFDLGVEYRQTYMRDDDMDVYNTPIWQNRWFDQYSMMNIYGAWKLGNKNSQHYDWLSPVQSIYDVMDTLNNRVNRLTGDKDGDHVADFWDRDNTTDSTCKVYGDGTAVDTDQDGIPDCKDKEIFSLCKDVDADGVAKDSDADGVPDCLDQEVGTKPGSLIDKYGRSIQSNCCNCEDMSFPSVIFDAGKCNIGGAQSVALAMIADKMKQCPDKKLVLCGAMGAGKKNKMYGGGKTSASLISCRTENIINTLVSQYGISRDRIDVQDCANGDAHSVTVKFKSAGSSGSPRSSR